MVMDLFPANRYLNKCLSHADNKVIDGEAKSLMNYFPFQGECLKDEDCPNDKACMDYFCINPCLMNSTCSAQDFCKVINHISVCGSNQGPQPEARTPVVIGGRYNPVQPRPESRTNIVIGGQYSGSQRGTFSNCVGRRCGASEGPSIVEAR